MEGYCNESNCVSCSGVWLQMAMLPLFTRGKCHTVSHNLDLDNNLFLNTASSCGCFYDSIFKNEKDTQSSLALSSLQRGGGAGWAPFLMGPGPFLEEATGPYPSAADRQCCRGSSQCRKEPCSQGSTRGCSSLSMACNGLYLLSCF